MILVWIGLIWYDAVMPCYKQSTSDPDIQIYHVTSCEDL